MVINHPAKFSGHGHGGIGDAMVLVCHKFLQVHVIKKLYDFMDGSPSR